MLFQANPGCMFCIFLSQLNLIFWIFTGYEDKNHHSQAVNLANLGRQ